MFDVKKNLIKVQGNRLYLPVAARLVWFRQEHPDWGIETRPHTIDTERQYAVFEATVYNAEGRLMAKGTKMEDSRGFPDYIEKAETGAIGRALAVCGFGTQFAPDLDEVRGAGRIVDAPQPIRSDSGSSADAGGYRSASQADLDSSGSALSLSSATPGTAAEHQCAGCGRALTRGQEQLSVRKFGAALCPACQRDSARRASPAAA